MLESLKKEANMTVTENGAATYGTTESDCLDLFATVGALRHASDGEIVTRFVRAYSENRDIAMKLLFFARDIRGGLGERRVFRVIFNWLAKNEPETVRKNIRHVAEYGRYDDLLALMGTRCEKDMMEELKRQFEADIQALKSGGDVSLLAKWIPSVNTSNRDAVLNAKKIARYFGMNDAAYRKALAALRAHIRIIENNLRERDYTFDYSKQPSKAMYKYRKAFMRNDGERYGRFMDSVVKGEVKLNTGALMPYDIISPFFSYDHHVTDAERKVADATWRSLEDFGTFENALAVIDGSGSMYSCSEPMPAAVALSLGIYFAERNTGAFKNHFITFSERPQLVEIKGSDIYERVRYCSCFNEIANTNIQRVF
ncbi:MAG: DUF2828 family protein, partial [Clostridia bacterium]|nr:DUF2828 family protein [Clostridia bacterium]